MRRSPRGAQPRHVGLDPGFVDEHQAGGIDAALIGAPAFAMTLYIRAILLAGDEVLIPAEAAHQNGMMSPAATE